MGRKSKNKGRAYERKIAGKIRNRLEMSEYDVRHSQSGKKEPDIYLSTAARKRLPYHFECKNHKVLRLPAWLKQSTEECGELTPTVVFKIHGSSIDYITLRLDDFLEVALATEKEVPLDSSAKEDSSGDRKPSHSTDGRGGAEEPRNSLRASDE